MSRTRRIIRPVVETEAAQVVSVPTQQWEAVKKPSPLTVMFDHENPYRFRLYEGLTKKQWEERGDILRILKRENYVNADILSLKDLRDVQFSMYKCQVLRLVANR